MPKAQIKFDNLIEVNTNYNIGIFIFQRIFFYHYQLFQSRGGGHYGSIALVVHIVFSLNKFIC